MDSVTRGLVEQISFGNQAKAFAGQEFEAGFGVIDHDCNPRLSVRMDQERVGLNDIDFPLKERGADLLHRLASFGEFDADQVAFDDRQPSPLEDFAASFGMAHDESDEGAFGSVTDGKRGDSDSSDFKATDHFEELSDAIFQEQRELA